MRSAATATVAAPDPETVAREAIRQSVRPVVSLIRAADEIASAGPALAEWAEDVARVAVAGHRRLTALLDSRPFPLEAELELLAARSSLAAAAALAHLVLAQPEPSEHKLDALSYADALRSWES